MNSLDPNIAACRITIESSDGHGSVHVASFHESESERDGRDDEHYTLEIPWVLRWVVDRASDCRGRSVASDLVIAVGTSDYDFEVSEDEKYRAEDEALCAAIEACQKYKTMRDDRVKAMRKKGL